MRILKEKWSVWYATVRYEEDSSISKDRPVVILDDRTTLCLSLKVTSKEKNDRYHVRLRQWEAAGLTRPSWVDISKTINVEEKDFISKVGMLDAEDILEIMKRLYLI